MSSFLWKWFNMASYHWQLKLLLIQGVIGARIQIETDKQKPNPSIGSRKPVARRGLRSWSFSKGSVARALGTGNRGDLEPESQMEPAGTKLLLMWTSGDNSLQVVESEHPDSSHLKDKSRGHSLLLPHSEAGRGPQPSQQAKPLSSRATSEEIPQI